MKSRDISDTVFDAVTGMVIVVLVILAGMAMVVLFGMLMKHIEGSYADNIKDQTNVQIEELKKEIEELKKDGKS